MKSFEDFMKEHGNLKMPNTYISQEKNNNNIDIKQKIVSSNEEKNVNTETNNQKYNELKELDSLKTKVLKYVLYKKRTEKEVKQKFSSITANENLLEEVIQNLKDNGYINDENYIKRAVDEHIAISTLSVKELRNKLYAKGLRNSIIDEYFEKNQEKLENYEIACAKKIIIKKQKQVEQKEIEQFLYKKGYKSSNVKLAFEELMQ